MITVGLINELRFIENTLRTPIEVTIKSDKFQSPLFIKINRDVLDVFYLGYHIWNEGVNLSDAGCFFGVESCSSIAIIMGLIDSGDDKRWRELVFKENT